MPADENLSREQLPFADSADSESPAPHPRGYSADLPVTGAWLSGDPPGNRQFFTLDRPHSFVLEGGKALRGVTVAYETWGQLASEGSNAVLICHALTGDSHVSGDAGHGHPTPGWWGEMVGPGKALDTDELFVVCANVLGGCQGTTGPASPNPDTGQPTVFIYDGYPGGIGIAERGFEAVEALWRTTLQAVEECPCSEGCTACVQSPKCGNNNFPLDKAVAAELLRGLLNLRR